MLRCYKKLLAILVTTVAIATSNNILLMYWIPTNIPLSSFSAVRMSFIAFIEKRYYLIIVGLLVGLLLLLTTFAIRKQQVFLPVLSLIYLIYDFIKVLALLINGFYDGYWIMYIVQTIVTAVLIVLLCTYCLMNIGGSRNTGDT